MAFPLTTSQPVTSHTKSSALAGSLFDAFLILLILVGVAFRFLWVNWSQGANLHPDEYGLTNTLTQLKIPSTLGNYFNTRISTINPYDKYDASGVKIADGPDNAIRWGQWPIILLKAAAEATGNTGYDQQRLLGRSLSALADALSMLLLFLTGRRLFNQRVALLATAFSALAVLQIQQSHFMTVDQIGVVFSTLSLYLAVRIAQGRLLVRPDGPASPYAAARSAWVHYALFGVAFGMALASRINLAPLAGMVIVAAFLNVADLSLRSRRDLEDILLYSALFLAAAGLAAVLTFRVTQPMSFQAATGDTTLFTVRLNPNWVASMQAASEVTRGIGGGPPQEQWANRPAILFPLENIVLWGLGLPLGLAAWAGVGWAAWQALRGKHWRATLLPLIWTVGYFVFMGTEWVKSVRYFLPIYPFLALFAAWALLAWWGWAHSRERPVGKHFLRLRTVLPGLAVGLVSLGTLAWATAYVQAVYIDGHTRIRATEWILHNIPGPFEVTIATASGPRGEPVPAPDGLLISPGQPYVQGFTTDQPGTVSTISLPHAAAVGTAPVQLRVRLARDAGGAQLLGETTLAVDPARADPRGGAVQAAFPGAALQPGMTYYLLASVESGQVRVSRTALSNETWDEALPVPFEGYDPFGQLYKGIDMQIRWG
ncbi:MAG TPA: glycosyltransferase family 39 protein, partial [Anaerolineaceae bacterium]